MLEARSDSGTNIVSSLRAQRSCRGGQGAEGGAGPPLVAAGGRAGEGPPAF